MNDLTKAELIDKLKTQIKLFSEQSILIEFLREQNNSLITQNAKLTSELEDTKRSLAWLQKQVFGRKSEKIVPTDDGQLSLGEQFKRKEPEQVVAKEKITYERKKSNERRVIRYGF